MSLRKMRSIGFTLIEMMIVVAILSVLAAIAGTAYRRYMDSGRKAEVYMMLGEIRSKEEAYKAENATYQPSDTGNVETTFYPALLGAGSEPKAKAWAAGAPANWAALGINPNKGQLYCGYVAVAGCLNTCATTAVAAGGRGAAIFSIPPSPQPTLAWWYAVATCDNDSDGSTAHNAYFTTSSQTTTVVVENEHW